jgi:hypothetical protein
MPVEIKELVIRAVAQGDATRSPVAGAAPSSAEAQQALVEAAVREVLRILKSTRER